jgi:hypothetical protein
MHLRWNCDRWFMQLNKSVPLKKTHVNLDSSSLFPGPCSLFHSMLHTVVIRRPDETTGLPGLRTLLQVMNDSRRRTSERGNFLPAPRLPPGRPRLRRTVFRLSVYVKIRWRTWQHQKEYISAVKCRLAVYHLPSDQRKLVYATALPFRARHVFAHRPSSVSSTPSDRFQSVTCVARSLT